MKKLTFVLPFTAIVELALPAGLLLADDLSEAARQISPARKIAHRPDRAGPERESPGGAQAPQQPPNYRTIDGTFNNLQSPDLGSPFSQLTRLFEPAYADGLSALSGPDRPNPRVISNRVVATEEGNYNRLGASDFLWQWGQFLDHDIDLTDGTDPAELANISVPDDDQYFPAGTEIEFNRSIYDPGTGIDSPRQQLNEITAWIDASNVYGSDLERAQALRTLDGTGKLKSSAGNFLPYNTAGLANAGGNSEQLFVAGDVRANEQVGLTVMHTLFMREHNRLTDELALRHPEWNGEQLYQKARQLVGAQMQVITYREYLPALLGPNALSPYQGYNSDIDPNISNVFSTAAYRYGHSALSGTIRRIEADGTTSSAGDLPLRNAFFAPWRLPAEGGLEPVLRGLASQQCQRVDPYLVEDVRSFLFGDPANGGFDLAALNIQRGRDHGLASYNSIRGEAGLPLAEGFSDITSDPDLQQRLLDAYGTVDNVDAWVGGLAEDPLPSSHLGLLFTSIVKEQFEALRDGDRYWYARTLSEQERRAVEGVRLADIIRRNTAIGGEIPGNVFRAAEINVNQPTPRPPRRNRP